MNIILFSASEVQLPLPASDLRARHIVQVLRRKPGDSFDAGLINGARGKATIVTINQEAITLDFVWGITPRPLDPIGLLVGLPRPQTARDILREGATLGVSAMDFFVSERGEPSYAQSTLWSSGEWETLLVSGAAQAFSTHVPTVRHSHTLDEALAALPTACTRIALDNYEAAQSLADHSLNPAAPIVIAVGSERGWSAGERTTLREHAFLFAHLGERVLRTETACITAVAVLKTRLGLF